MWTPEYTIASLTLLNDVHLSNWIPRPGQIQFKKWNHYLPITGNNTVLLYSTDHTATQSSLIILPTTLLLLPICLTICPMLLSYNAVSLRAVVTMKTLGENQCWKQIHLSIRGKVFSWEYRSPRKQNSRPPASVILCWVSWVENVLLIYYASSDLLVCLHGKKSLVYGVFGQ